jgi:hypothetical protein
MMVPPVESFFLSWNPIALVFAFVILSAALGLLVDWLLARLSRWLEKGGHLREQHHEIAGHFIGVVGVIYAVLVAFVVVTAWQTNDHAKDLTMQEQHEVDDLFHLDAAFHNLDDDRIRLMLANYSEVMSDEWQEMKRGDQLCLDTSATCPPSSSKPSQQTNRLAHCIREATFDLVPQTRQQQVVYEEGIRLVQSFSENREERRRRYQERALQGALWFSFILGATILVFMTYFVEGQSRVLHGIRTSGFFAMIGMLVALAFIFDRPFVGASQVSGGEWNVLQTHFAQDLRAPTTSDRIAAEDVFANCKE